MEMRIKTALYAYPQLERLGRDYEEHIKNKAMLSYGSRWATEKLTEYIATEIVRKQNVYRLKEELDKILSRLNEEERLLLEARYFGKMDRVRRLFAAQEAGLTKTVVKPWCERTYYRKQAKVLKKIVGLFKAGGMDESNFDETYLDVEYLGLLFQYVAAGKEVGICKKERQLLEFLKTLNA